MSELSLHSPLVGRPPAVHGQEQGSVRAGVVLHERPFLGHILLRGNADDTAFLAACRAQLDVDLPLAPNTTVETDSVVICWQRPTEWLLMCEPDACQAWLAALRDALAEVHAGVVGVSGGQTVITLAGEHARDVLAKGTTLDLHPRVFGPGQCARTLLAKTTVFLRPVAAGQAIEVVVRRSFADYLWQWLVDAGQEYGCHIAASQSVMDTDAGPVDARRRAVG